MVGAALVLVIEGLLWALAPHLAMRLLRGRGGDARAPLRSAGRIAVAVAVAIVWLVRG